MLKFLLRVLISVVFIGLLFYLVREDIPAIKNVLRNIDRRLFVVSLGIFMACVGVLAWRLKLIFTAEEVPLTFLGALQLTFIGYFFNNFLPTSVGGDVVKALCASRITKEPVKSVTSVLMDRIFGLFTFIMIPSISLLFFLKQMTNPAVPILTYSFLAFSFFFFLLLFNRNVAKRFRFIETWLNKIRLGDKVRRIYEGLHNFKRHKVVVVQAMLLSVVGQAVSIVVLFLFARALGAKAPLIYFFLLIPVVHLLSMLPSLNGLGIREGAYVYFLTPYIGREYSVALGILWLFILLLMSFIGGIIYLVRHDYHIQFKSIKAREELT